MNYKEGQFVCMAKTIEDAKKNFDEGDRWVLVKTNIGLVPKELNTGSLCAGGLNKFDNLRWFIIDKSK